MEGEKLTLTWDDFDTSAPHTFRQLLGDTDFTDVTLASADNQQIAAHKVVLSSCSPFFRNILVRNPHQKPLLYLRGIKHAELQLIVRFIYLGECDVRQEDLDSFLETGKDLEINGLRDEENINEENSTKDDEKGNKPLQEATIAKNLGADFDNEKKLCCNKCSFQTSFKQNLDAHLREVHSENQCPVEEGKFVKTDQIKSADKKVNCDKIGCTSKFKDNLVLKKHKAKEHKEEVKEEITTIAVAHNGKGIKRSRKGQNDKEPIKPMKMPTIVPTYKNANGKFPCDKCKLESPSNFQLTNHKLAVHFNYKFSCDQCSYQNKSEAQLKNHKAAEHAGAMLTCDQCDYENGYKFNIYLHKKRKHGGLKPSTKKF